jgi:hypothetical protein
MSGIPQWLLQVSQDYLGGLLSFKISVSKNFVSLVTKYQSMKHLYPLTQIWSL